MNSKAILMSSGKFLLYSILTILITGNLSQLKSQGTRVNLNALISETQKTTDRTDEMIIVWWVPQEFWEVSLEQDPTITKEQVEQFLEVLGPYTLVITVEGAVGPYGGISYLKENDIRNHIRIKAMSGEIFSPLNEDDISGDAKNILSMIQPVLANTIGPMGENMHFFLFPATNADGKKLADTKSSSNFFVFLGEKEFRWRLPLGSLLPERICTMCGEKLSGAFNYCPYCGVKL